MYITSHYAADQMGVNLGHERILCGFRTLGGTLLKWRYWKFKYGYYL